MTRELHGTATLLRLALKRDRIRLPVWLIAVGLLLAGGGQELAQVFSSPAERQVRATLMGQPSGIFLGGPGYGLDDYTVGAMMANEYTLFIVVAVAIMALQMAVRHTRGEESAGRIELLRSTRVGRHAAPAAATLMLIITATLIMVVCAGSMLTLDLPVRDSVAYGAGIGLQVLVFGAVGLLCAQLSSTPRGAMGLGLAVLGARRRPGIDVVLDLVGLDAAVAGADLLLTGEGSLDEQSLGGKTPLGVLHVGRRHGVPVVAVCGPSRGLSTSAASTNSTSRMRGCSCAAST